MFIKELKKKKTKKRPINPCMLNFQIIVSMYG